MTKEEQIERRKRQRNCKENEIAKTRMVQALHLGYHLVVVAVRRVKEDMQSRICSRGDRREGVRMYSQSGIRLPSFIAWIQWHQWGIYGNQRSCSPLYITAAQM